MECSYTRFLMTEAEREAPWTVWKPGVYPTRVTAADALASSGSILLDGQIPHKNHVFMEYPL